MESKSFKELDAWKKSRELVRKVYNATKMFPKDEMFGLTNQVRRSAVSIPANIAEGIGRNTSKDTMQFLFIARGSIYELETLLILSFDQEYIKSMEEFDNLLIDIRRMINGLINYYNKK